MNSWVGFAPRRWISNIHPVAIHERRWCLWCNVLPQIRTTIAAHKLQSLAGNAHPLKKMHPPMWICTPYGRKCTQWRPFVKMYKLKGSVVADDQRLQSLVLMKSLLTQGWNLLRRWNPLTRMKLNPSISPAARRISSQSDFIPRKWDLFRPKGRI